MKPKYAQEWRRRLQKQGLANRKRAEQARASLPATIKVLRKYGAKKIILFGSLLEPERFHRNSDIDLAESGIATEKFCRAFADLMMALDWPVDLKPLEEVHEPFRGRILRKGEVLYI